MSGLVNKVLISASAMGLSAFVAAPAFAGSITGASVSGTHLLYEAQGTSTVLNNSADLADVLQGDFSNPGGNIELSGTTSHSNAADMTNATVLQGAVDGENVFISSLTTNDWLSGNYGNRLIDKWFYEAWHDTSTGFQTWVSDNYSTTDYSAALMGFEMFGGYKRFSDPNVSYVNTDSSGDLFVGLAGHLNHSSGVNLSEVVKVTYQGDTKFLYAMGDAFDSGMTSVDDGVSHTGLYNLRFSDNTNVPPAADVPEPSTMLGLLAVGSLFGLAKRKVEA
ncbi:NF038130 family PEP-CTERM protein [Baaleninema sp.]|uniref:NF038130 family PEP-CTERM protein n=1 Tax=Baaleninema sp. TaxID=3101197 RepID=UPI003D072C40